MTPRYRHAPRWAHIIEGAADIAMWTLVVGGTLGILAYIVWTTGWPAVAAIGAVSLVALLVWLSTGGLTDALSGWEDAPDDDT